MDEKKENQAPECGKNNDLRTFAIALITAVIVVALYHFGCGLCKIFCSDSCDAVYPAPRYMLVRVMDAPMPMDEEMHHPGPGKFGPGKFGPGKFGMKGKHHFHQGGPRGRRPGFKGHGQFRKGPRPDDVNPAEPKKDAAKPAEPKKDAAKQAPAAK